MRNAARSDALFSADDRYEERAHDVLPLCVRVAVREIGVKKVQGDPLVGDGGEKNVVIAFPKVSRETSSGDEEQGPEAA